MPSSGYAQGRSSFAANWSVRVSAIGAKRTLGRLGSNDRFGEKRTFPVGRQMPPSLVQSAEPLLSGNLMTASLIEHSEASFARNAASAWGQKLPFNPCPLCANSGHSTGL